MKQRLTKRIVSLLLVLAMLATFAVPLSAADAGGEDTASLSFKPVDDGLSLATLGEEVSIDELAEEAQPYEDTELVRVSIVLEKASTLDAGFSTQGIASNAEAMAYREMLRDNQVTVTSKIEARLGGKLDVSWNLTLAANIISATVEYGQIAAISEIPGVRSVTLERRYEPAVLPENDAQPQMITSTTMTDSNLAWAAGYTGAGSRIAVIDTGIDTDHQSFDAAAFEYSLACQAEQKELSTQAYVESLNLLDAAQVEAVKDKLNVSIDPTTTYVSSKIPFAYNYIDQDYDITHDNDTQGEHGSHVEGIAAANAYIPMEDGTYGNALLLTHVQGVAPDAQILVMKVFGKGGGAYDSDYMAAIEDAILLGCDSVNLSLGSANPGFSLSSDYEDIMESLTASDTVVAIAAGNNGTWADSALTEAPYLYADDISMNTVAEPGAYTNALTVASADNTSEHKDYILVGEHMISYTQSSNYSNAAIKTLAGEHEYVFIDGIGTAEQFDAVGDALKGKIAVCSRGETAFYEKANLAVEHGAVAIIVYNNQAGTINMNLEGYLYKAPAVSITQADGALLKAQAQPVNGEDGSPLYYLGKLEVASEIGFFEYDSEYVTMSSFSSMGVPDSLILKPEITAPGGNIYSVNGMVPGGKEYVSKSGTSMATPQVAGMAALVAQYIRDNNLEEKTGLSARQLITSLLMSTATPEIEEASGSYWTVMKQGAGLANVNNAISAGSYIRMESDATDAWADGKVKAELMDDPDRTGKYGFTFTVNNFSAEEKNYTLSADFFTQGTLEKGEYTYLDTMTTPIAADVSYTVDGQAFRPTATIACDLDKDGDTDPDDAQLILQYCAGNLAEIDSLADVNQDGVVSTYDAHLILNNLETQAFTVAPGGSVKVHVDVSLSDSLKAWLDANYVDGAYIEGYVFAEPVTTEEGEIGVTHSIPVLGFYGGWTEASMFEKSTVWEYLYGTATPNYSGNAMFNALYVISKGSNYAVVKQPNPYMTEDDIPMERLAVRSTDKFFAYQYAMIRNTASFAVVDLSEDGKVEQLLAHGNGYLPAFYYSGDGAWHYASNWFFPTENVGSMGLQEGDCLNWTLVAIPEYYLPTLGASEEETIAVIESGILGDGAFVSMPMMVDDTAPELLGVTKDLLTGDLTVTASDANYIATVQILSANGATCYASALPEATERGQITSTTFELDNASVGATCIIALGDYAGNESFYEVSYGGDVTNIGELYAFTSDATRAEASGWFCVTPDTLHYTNYSIQGGMTHVADGALNVKAAEYVDGKVFVAADDGNFYVTDHGKWEDYKLVGSYTGVINMVYDMAYNPVDGKIYVTDGTSGKICALDLYTGEFARVATVMLVNPRGGPPMYRYPKALAIAPDGTFYAVNWASGNNTFLYRFVLDDIASGSSSTIQPINSFGPLNISTTGQPVMAWNEVDGKLYMADNTSGTGTKLWTLDPSTGAASLANPDKETYGDGASVLYSLTPGLYAITGTDGCLKRAEEASSVELSAAELTVVQGAFVTLTAKVSPWNLKDASVKWESSDSSVVSVNEAGVATALKPGTAVLTATSCATPELSAQCTITVEPVPEISLSGLVTKADGSSFWADFTTAAPAAYTWAGDSKFYVGGALLGDQLYVHSNNNLYRIDADSFAITRDYGHLETGWSWSDAAPAPASKEGYFGGIASVCYDGRYFMIDQPDSANIQYWNLSDTFLSDPMTMLAYKESGSYKDYPAIYYYTVTESGALWELVIYTMDQGSNYTIALNCIGATGIDLNNVAMFLGTDFGSMIYDEATGYLVAAVSNAEGSTLYLIDPATAIAADLGSFGSETWPVTTLYQYQRATELELRLSRTEAEIYEGDQLGLTVKVRPAQYTGGVVWSSSEETVATVDENGIVTALAEGTTVITVTSEDVNAEGKPVTAQCVITVKPLTPLDATVNAQIETADGIYWAQIDLNNSTTQTKAETTLKMTGTGYSYGKIFGSAGDHENGGYYYAVDPANAYAETVGLYAVKPGNMWLDVASGPAAPYTYNGEEHTAFAAPITISMDTLYVYVDPIAGNATGITIKTTHPGLAAISFYDWYYTGGSNSAPVYEYLALDIHGTIHSFRMQASPDSSFGGALKNHYDITSSIVGNIGLEFLDQKALSMTTVRDPEKGLNGLVISDCASGVASLYYVDMSAEELSYSKICDLDGVVDIAGLYSDFEMTENVADAPTADAPTRFVEGTATTASSPVSMHMAPAASQSMNVNMVGGAVQTGEATGFTNESVAQPVEKAISAPEGAAISVSDGTVKLTLSETEETTNGILELAYDPALLSFKDISSPIANTALHVENGKLIFDYAAAKALPVGSTLATVCFTYGDVCLNTALTVKTLQRNADNTVAEKALELPAVYGTNGHTLEKVNGTPATCTEAGTEDSWKCTACGKLFSDEKGETEITTAATIPATGHNFVDGECTVCHAADPNWEEPFVNPFIDVKESDWFYPYVMEMAKDGVINGYSDHTFRPNVNLTRAEMVTLLYRASGSPEVSGKASFTDVPANAWYLTAVTWAEEKGVVNGVGNGEFEPEEDVSREQLVTMLWRLAGKPESDEDLNAYGFADVAKVNSWAKTAMQWAVANKIVNGTTFTGKPGTYLAPQDSTTRAEAAKILCVHLEME